MNCFYIGQLRLGDGVVMRNSKIPMALNNRAYTHTLCMLQTGCSFAPHNFHAGTRLMEASITLPVLVVEGKGNTGKRFLCFKLLLRSDTCRFCLHVIGQSKTNF